MRRLLLIPLFVLLSCNQQSPAAKKKNASKQQPVVVQRPADLIPQDKMVLLLADVHLLESALAIRAPQAIMHNRLPGMPIDTMLPGPPQPGTKEPLPYYDIFKKHNVTRKQYEASMAWYATQPDVLNGIYDEVIAELTRRQAGERGIIPDTLPPNPAQDSAPHKGTIVPSGSIKK